MRVALACVAAAAVGYLGWQIGFDPETRFPSAHAPAEWLTEPLEPSSSLRQANDREVLFRTLRALPSSALLRARIHRAGRVLLNGPGLRVGSDAGWTASAIDGSPQPARLANTPMRAWTRPGLGVGALCSYATYGSR